MIENINLRSAPKTISLMTEDNGIAELCSLPKSLVHAFNKDNGTQLRGEVLYFNRLKVKKYRKGYGSELMKRVLEICNAHRFSIICDVNVYDPLIINLENLIKFYESFGLTKVASSCLIYKRTYPL